MRVRSADCRLQNENENRHLADMADGPGGGGGRWSKVRAVIFDDASNSSCFPSHRNNAPTSRILRDPTYSCSKISPFRCSMSGKIWSGESQAEVARAENLRVNNPLRRWARPASAQCSCRTRGWRFCKRRRRVIVAAEDVWKAWQ